jgi:uncharacterized membrane protein
MVKWIIAGVLFNSIAMAETTFLIDVLPIVDKRCAMCHVEFIKYDYLVANTYLLTSPRAKSLLSERERAVIKAWISEGKKK